MNAVESLLRRNGIDTKALAQLLGLDVHYVDLLKIYGEDVPRDVIAFMESVILGEVTPLTNSSNARPRQSNANDKETHVQKTQR